jgi:hypothetical protein
MLARSLRSRALTPLTTLAIAACASTASLPSHEPVTLARVPSLTPTSRVLDAERIRRSGAQTAWEAIRLLVPSYRFQSARSSSLRTFSAPNTRDFASSIRLMIDGHQISDLDVLHSIPTREIIAIHVLSATEAATYFGPGSSGGAIVVQTRIGLRAQ